MVTASHSVDVHSYGSLLDRPQSISKRNRSHARTLLLVFAACVCVCLAAAVLVSGNGEESVDIQQPVDLESMAVLKAQLQVSKRRLGSLTGQAAQQEAEHAARLQLRINKLKQQKGSSAHTTLSSTPPKATHTHHGSLSLHTHTSSQRDTSSELTLGNGGSDHTTIGEARAHTLLSRAKLQKEIFLKEKRQFLSLKSEGLKLKNQGMRLQLRGQAKKEQGAHVLAAAKVKLRAAIAARKLFRRYNLSAEEKEAVLLQQQLQRRSHTLALRAKQQALKARRLRRALSELNQSPGNNKQQ